MLLNARGACLVFLPMKGAMQKENLGSLVFKCHDLVIVSRSLRVEHSFYGLGLPENMN